MTEPLRYATGRDLLAAVRAKAADEARRSGQPKDRVLREFVYDRLLARLFHGPEVPWVLKGGNALMSREPAAARASLDLDFAARSTQDNLDSLLHSFEVATEVDCGDHFRFVIVRRRGHHEGDTQPHVVGYQLTLDAYCGIKKVTSIKVDLVTGTLITADPQPLIRPSLPIAGLGPVFVIVYPIADHVADKVCATAETHGSAGRSSSRVRDLVDLVVIATTQRMDAGELARAITREWNYRGLRGAPTLDPPSGWASQYVALARRTPGCVNYSSFEGAVQLVRDDFLGPVLTGQIRRALWDPVNRVWA